MPMNTLHNKHDKGEAIAAAGGGGAGYDIEWERRGGEGRKYLKAKCMHGRWQRERVRVRERERGPTMIR